MWRNETTRRNEISSLEPSFSKKSSLKIYQVYLNLANSRRDRRLIIIMLITHMTINHKISQTSRLACFENQTSRRNSNSKNALTRQHLISVSLASSLIWEMYRRRYMRIFTDFLFQMLRIRHLSYCTATSPSVRRRFLTGNDFNYFASIEINSTFANLSLPFPRSSQSLVRIWFFRKIARYKLQIKTSIKKKKKKKKKRTIRQSHDNARCNQLIRMNLLIESQSQMCTLQFCLQFCKKNSRCDRDEDLSSMKLRLYFLLVISVIFFFFLFLKFLENTEAQKFVEFQTHTHGLRC